MPLLPDPHHRMVIRRRALIGLALLAPLALAACGQLPQPYQPDNKNGLNLRLLAESSMLVIEPTQGDAPGQPLLFADALEEALVGEGLLVRKAESPAPLKAGLRLESTARLLAMSAEENLLRIDWRVVDPAGDTAANSREEVIVAQSLWRRGDRKLFRKLARQAAKSLADQLLGDPLQAVKLPGFPGARLVITGVQGAPGDGNDSLHRAFRRILQDTDLPSTEIAEPGDLLIRCLVTLGEPKNNQQVVTLTWQVSYLDPNLTGPAAIDGKLLGEISQANLVPVGALDGAWGALAYQISRAAFQGIKDLLAQAGQQRIAG